MCEQAILDKELHTTEDGEEVTITLERAAHKVIEGLIEKGESFTAWNVTKVLRQAFNWDGGKNHIAHNDVRNVVGHLFHAGAMGDWMRTTDPDTHGAMRYSAPEEIEADEDALLADATMDVLLNIETDKASDPQDDQTEDEAELLAVD